MVRTTGGAAQATPRPPKGQRKGEAHQYQSLQLCLSGMAFWVTFWGRPPFLSH